MRPILELLVGTSEPVPALEPGAAVPHVSMRCDGAGRCVDVCPRGVLTRVLRRVRVVSPASCNGCNRCVEVCPDEAITLINGITGHPIG